MAGLEIPALNGGVELRNSTLHGGISIPMFDRVFAYWYLVGNAWECMGMDGKGMIINSHSGSFPHSLLSTIK